MEFIVIAQKYSLLVVLLERMDTASWTILTTYKSESFKTGVGHLRPYLYLYNTSCFLT